MRLDIAVAGSRTRRLAEENQEIDEVEPDVTNCELKQAEGSSASKLELLILE
jgi:hypothetical protein